jgi:predicted RNase H-like nuclease (RuvC/YqgF family)
MKKYFISMLMLVSLSAFAMPSPNNKNEKKANATAISTVSTVESNAAVTMKQLQEENQILRQQMLELSNENEELKGMISFQGMMQKMFAQMVAQKQNEESEELKAQISYNNLMSNLIRTLKATSVK